MTDDHRPAEQRAELRALIDRALALADAQEEHMIALLLAKALDDLADAQ